LSPLPQSEPSDTGSSVAVLNPVSGNPGACGAVSRTTQPTTLLCPQDGSYLQNGQDNADVRLCYSLLYCSCLAAVMSSALAKASPLKPEIRLAQAVSEFEADLSHEQKSTFRTLRSQSLSTTPSPRDVMQLTAEVDRHTSKKFSSACFGPRFTNFLHGVQQFAALGDVVIGGSQNLIACGVWSLVRMSLLVSALFSHDCRSQSLIHYSRS
jgi:hypothetical protein